MAADADETLVDENHGHHRLIGVGLALLGLALLVAQLVMLYGSGADRELMLRIGLPGVAVLSSTGAICFGVGCLLAAAPRTTLHHVRRASHALRRRA